MAAVFCWVDEDGARVLADEDILAEWWQRTDPAFVACLCYEVEQFNEGGFRFTALERLGGNVRLPSRLPPVPLTKISTGLENEEAP